MRMVRQPRGLTLVEVVVTLGVLVLVGLLLVWRVAAAREEGRRIRCRDHLNCVGKSMATYLNEYGNNRWYPCPLGRGAAANDYNGAEWLATNFWVGIHPDPRCFLCPSSGDTNHDGRDFGTDRAVPGLFGSQTVSYAAMHHRSRTDASGNPKALQDDFSPNEPMASDDTEGALNHARRGHRGMSVVFFDSHVELRTERQIDAERGVGQQGGLLWRLRN